MQKKHVIGVCMCTRTQVAFKKLSKNWLAKGVEVSHHVRRDSLRVCPRAWEMCFGGWGHRLPCRHQRRHLLVHPAGAQVPLRRGAGHQGDGAAPAGGPERALALADPPSGYEWSGRRLSKCNTCVCSALLQTHLLSYVHEKRSRNGDNGGVCFMLQLHMVHKS